MFFKGGQERSVVATRYFGRLFGKRIHPQFSGLQLQYRCFTPLLLGGGGVTRVRAACLPLQLFHAVLFDELVENNTNIILC
jgi:hypothetical protein